MPGRSVAKRIGIFGGTFDPVHYGHLRTADALVDRLQLDEMRLMPAGLPAHRPAPLALAEQRWQMVQIALAEFPRLRADDRDIRRGGPTYSVDALTELRAELGDEVRLLLCMGWDSLCSFTRWHRWQDLLGLCALVAVSRPHHAAADAELPRMLQDRLVQTLAADNGSLLLLAMDPLPMSATRLRELAAQDGVLPANWIPPAVASYINQHGLYGMK